MILYDSYYFIINSQAVHSYILLAICLLGTPPQSPKLTISLSGHAFINERYFFSAKRKKDNHQTSHPMILLLFLSFPFLIFFKMLYYLQLLIPIKPIQYLQYHSKRFQNFQIKFICSLDLT